MVHMTTFGAFVHKRREALKAADGGRYSLRQVALRIGIEPAYLSKIENEKTESLSEEKIRSLAAELMVDDVELLARANKVPTDVLAIIRTHPRAFADLILALRDKPESAIFRVVREVSDGDW